MRDIEKTLTSNLLGWIGAWNDEPNLKDAEKHAAWMEMLERQWCQIEQFYKHLSLSQIMDAGEKAFLKLGKSERTFNYFAGICKNWMFENPTCQKEHFAGPAITLPIYVIYVSYGIDLTYGFDKEADGHAIGPFQSEAEAEIACISLSERFALAVAARANNFKLSVAIAEGKDEEIRKKYNLPEIPFDENVKFHVQELEPYFDPGAETPG